MLKSILYLLRKLQFITADGDSHVCRLKSCIYVEKCYLILFFILIIILEITHLITEFLVLIQMVELICSYNNNKDSKVLFIHILSLISIYINIYTISLGDYVLIFKI